MMQLIGVGGNIQNFGFGCSEKFSQSWFLNRSEVKRRTAVISKNVWKHAIVCQEWSSERNTNI